VLAATRGIGRRGRFIAYGVGAGIVGASALAYFAGALSDALAGRGQEVFNASILALAAVMLGWHNLWMASHGRELTREWKAMGQAVAAGDKSLVAMMIVVAIAVLREGAEVVLFMYGIASSSTGWPALLFGRLLGMALGTVVAFLLYVGLVAIPGHRLFFVTSWLIALVAAGMAGQTAATLASIDLIPSWGYELWDTSWMLPQDSIPGRATGLRFSHCPSQARCAGARLDNRVHLQQQIARQGDQLGRRYARNLHLPVTWRILAMANRASE